MAKGIVVVDIPSECRYCICCLFDDLSSRYCGIDKDERNVTIIGMNEKPDWCPIKPIPDRKSEDFGQTIIAAARGEGWNECLDEILKGE